MAVQFSCPQCGKVLKSSNPLTPGKKVKCPACAAIFSPAPAKAAAPAKRPPLEEDDATVDLRQMPTEAPTASKKAARPMPPALEEEDEDLPPPRPKAGAPAKKTAPPIDDDDEDEDEEGLPPRKSKAAIQARKPAPRPDEEDEDDLPPARPGKAGAKPGAVQAKKPVPPANDFGFEDDEMAEDLPPLPAKGKKAPPPLKKGKARDEVEEDELDEEDEDDRPRKKGKPVKGKKKSNAMLLIIVGVAVAVLALGAVALFVWPGFLKEDAKIAGPQMPPGGAGMPPDGAGMPPDGAGMPPDGAGMPPGGPGMPPDGKGEHLGDPLAYVPANAFAVGGLDVRGVRTGKILSSLYQMVTDKAREETKAAPMEFREALDEVLNNVDKVVIAPLPTDSRGKEPVLTAISFSAPVDMEKVKLVTSAREVEGKDFFRLEGGPFFAKLHPQIILACDTPLEDFEKHLAGVGKAVQIDAELKTQVDQVRDALLFFAMANTPEVQAKTGELAEMAKLAGDEKLVAAAQAALKSKAATFAIRDAGEKLDFKVRLVCQSEPDAAAIDSAVSGFVKTLPFLVDIMLGKKDMGESPVPPQMVKAIKSVIGTFESGVDGEEVWMSVSLSQADVNAIQALARTWFLGAAGPGPVPKKVPGP